MSLRQAFRDLQYHTVSDESLISKNTTKGHSEANIVKSGNWYRLLILAAIVFGCTLVILLTVLYLTFLWTHGPSKTAWTVIILSNWTATSVAICGVTIRWMSSLQMALCTSVLAWNMLKEGTTLSKVSRLSTLRYNNAGPLDFVYLIRLHPNGAFHLHLFVVTLLSILTTIMLQFSSTLLLSDLTTGPVQTFRNMTTRPILSNESVHDTTWALTQGHYYTDAMVTTSPSYPLFAELSSDHPPQQSKTVDDTGSVIRALLPVSAEDGRSTLLSFEGNATLYDARVICTPPALSYLSLIGIPPLESLSFAGYTNHSSFLPRMASTDASGYGLPFNCSITLTQDFSSIWTLFTCPLYSYSDYGQGLINSLDNVYDDKVYQANAEGQMQYGATTHDAYTVSPLGESWLVINATNMNTSSLQFPAPGAMKFAFWNSTEWTASSSGLWTRVTSTQEDGLRLPDQRIWPQGNWSFALDVSVCSSAYAYTKSLYIKAKRDIAVNEPVSLTGGAAQIGASSSFQTREERGIMMLNETELNHELSVEREAILRYELSQPLLPTSDLLRVVRDGDSWNTGRVWFPNIMLSGDEAFDQGSVSEDRMTLFQNVIQTTNSPALAIQSMIHTYVTDRYYKFAPYYTNSTVQWTTFSVNAIQPVRYWGYIAVVTSIGTHLFLVAYILIVFGVVQGTKRTICSVDQAWQVFAQVALLQQEVSFSQDEDERNIVSSTNVTDDEVKSTLKRRGIYDKIFVLSEDQNGMTRFKTKVS